MDDRDDLPRPAKSRVRPEQLMIAGLWLLASLSCLHFVQLSREVWSSGFFDFPIFLGHARRFVSTGVLYVDDLSRYHPGAPIYKYPPLYAVLLLPVVRWAGKGLFFYHWLLQIGVYLCALALAIRMFMPRHSRWFVPAALILLLNFPPFFETLAGLQIEGPILLLLVLCAFFFSRAMGLLAGAVLGIAVMLKVYPVFLLLYFALRARWDAIAGCVATMIAITLGTIWAIGPTENAKYFFDILPHIASELPRVSPESASISNSLMLWGGVGPHMAKWIAQLIFLALLAATGLAFARSRKIADDPQLLLLELSAFIAVMLLGLMNSWQNYQLLLVIGISCTLSHCARDGDAAGGLPRVTLLIATLFACFLMLFSRNAAMLDFLLSSEIRDSLMSLRILSTVAIWGALVASMYSFQTSQPAARARVEREAS